MDERHFVDYGLHPTHFGISCALFTLKTLSQSKLDADDKEWMDVRGKILQFNAHLLGLLVWSLQRDQANATEKYELLQKLETHQREIEELKRRRSEDAKANEKVVSIYAAQKQRWFNERNNMRQHIGALMNELRVLETRKNEEVSKLSENLQEMEAMVNLKDKSLEEEASKRKDVEEKLETLEAVVEQLREASEQEAQAHACELWKHKTAFLEFVSNQRQIEAELGRAIRQAEAAKQQLDFVFEEKEEMMLLVEKLSIETRKIKKDSEQKDKILSAMLRKSKLDSAEKDMLSKELNLSEVKKKQAELEINRWRNNALNPKGRNERHSLRSMLSRQVSSRLGAFPTQTSGNLLELPSDGQNATKQSEFGHDLTEFRRLAVDCSPELNGDFPQGFKDLDMLDDSNRVEDWVCLEAGKYRAAVEQRHQAELEAFADQLRRKDEKLEAYHWRLLTLEMESKKSNSQIEDLNQGISRLRHNNMKLETLLIEKETELKSLKDQISVHMSSLKCQRTTRFSSSRPLADNIVWSKFEVTKRTTPVGRKQDVRNLDEVSGVSKPVEDECREEIKSVGEDAPILDTTGGKKGDFEEVEKVAEEPHVHPPDEEETTNLENINVVTKEVTSTRDYLYRIDREPGKMDIHALGVSYKIKRLKQQLLMLERITGKQGNVDHDSEECDNNFQNRMKGFVLLLALLNKQVGRFQSLQEKTDDLRRRMREKDLNIMQGDSTPLRTKEDSRTLEHFLEETFQLQRFIVATGQKLMEVQSKIVPGFIDILEKLDVSSSFDMKRFADNIQSLFKEVQRGLEIRIARIIGDLEGTLACDGIRSRRH